MTKTEIASLALSYLGEPALSNIDTDTSTAGVAARLHYATALASLLEDHPWSFARATAEIAPAEASITYKLADGYTFGDGTTSKTFHLSLTQQTDFAIIYTGTDSDGNAYTLTKAALLDYATITAFDSADNPLSQFEATSATTTERLPFLADFTTIDAAMESVTAELHSSFPPWTTTHDLPAACIRVLRLATSSDTSLERFEIAGRQILSDTGDFIQLYYTDGAVAEASFPSSFTNALALLLAAQLARPLAQSDQLANDLLQKHKLALSQALTKDTRETRSGENMTPRRLALRSSLWRSRFRNNGGPGFDR